MHPAAGIAGIHTRIAEIESRFARVASPAGPTSAGPTPAGSAGAPPQADFGAHLRAALGGQPVAASSGGAGGQAAAVPGGPASSAPVGGSAPTTAARATPPPELVGHGNGRIPPAALEPLGIGEHRLWRPAAVAFGRLEGDARAAGITIKVTDSYRSYDEQVDLARRKGLYSQGGLAATPGTSNHGWGLSVDLGLDDRALAWMRDNAGRYGFVEDVPREPWHWTFHGTG